MSVSEYSEYKVIRSSRKTLAIEINPKEGVIVRAPFGVSDGYIRRTVEQKREWIESHMQKLHERTGASARKLTSEEIAKLYQKAAEYLPVRTKELSRHAGLYPKSVKITSAKKRFGSCGADNGICYSLFLMRYPEQFIDYVIYHELCHIRYKNHGPKFHALLESFVPGHRRVKELAKNIPVLDETAED